MPRKSQYRGEEKLAIRNEFDQGLAINRWRLYRLAVKLLCAKILYNLIFQILFL